MALCCTVRYCLECSNFRFFRKPLSAIQIHKFYSLKSNENKSDGPVIYSKTSVSKLSAAENLKLKDSKEHVWFKPYIIAGSLIFFLAYFGFFREENDIDEIIRGNPDFVTDQAKYFDLKLKLSYCEQNHLPTAALKAKIEELEKKLVKT